MFTFQIGSIFHGCAETCRANHSTVCASETTCSNVVPPRVLVVSVEQLLDIHDFHFPPHLLRGPFVDALCRLLFSHSRRAVRKLRQNIGAEFRPDFHQEIITAFIQDLRQSKVRTKTRLRSGVHRYAKTCATCLTTVHSHDENSLSPGSISCFNMLAVDEYTILDRDCV